MEAASASKQRKSSKQRAKTSAPASLARAGTVLAAGGNCPSCGAEMAGDQRYCLECGDRRGPSRLPVRETAARPTSESGAAGRKRRRFSPNATLITGVAALLIAMGTGVLIGRSGDLSNSKGNSGVQVVTAPTGGATSTTAATNSATANAGKSGGGGVVKPQASTSSGEGTATQALPPPTVTVGQAGHGAGYTGGKFTGNFFGPGK